jgi:hypothetical protein
VIAGAARERMVGSVDRHAQPDQPDPGGRPDAAREQPESPRETEAQLAERLGLPTLTRASAYESLYARALAQDAPFRERLAREEAASKRESLSSAGESRAPRDPPKPPIDKPERDIETTRTYWTEVPRFLSLEGLRKDFSWKFTPAIVEWQAGDLGQELVEVSHERAEKIIEYFRGRWGAGEPAGA